MNTFQLQQQIQLTPEQIEKIRTSHSAFWMGDDIEDLMHPAEVNSIMHIERLRKVQRATGNFVNIVTGKNIPVIFSSGEQSYTDGKSVVISAKLDPTTMDAMVGLSLHEGTHCAISNAALAFLPEMHKQIDMMLRGHEIMVDAKRLGIPLTEKHASAAAMGKVTHTVMGHIQFIMNVLEDRRIDLWQYQNAPGYRPYYDAMYNQYWHSPKIDEALQDPKFRTPSVMSYMLFTINMTNKHFDQSALPQLDRIRQIANLTAKGLFARGDDDPNWKRWKYAMNTSPANFDSFPKLFADAVKIVSIMYRNSLTADLPPEPKDKDKNKPQQSQAGDLPNMDGGGPVEMTMEELKDALTKQLNFLNHQVGKEKIAQEVQEIINQLDATQAQVVDVQGEFLPRDVKARVIVYRNVTKAEAKKPEFPYNTHGRENHLMVKALNDGIAMGQVLAQRIRVMQDERPLTFNRQEHGKLDKRRVAMLGTGVTDVFATTYVERKKPVNIWLDVDFSGSMMGDKAADAMKLAIAIAFAAEKTRTLNVVIAVRDGGNDVARVAILYDSRKQRFAQFRDIVPWIQAAGGTPESLTFEAVKEEMMTTYKNERKFFMNFSDGAPGHAFSYKGRRYSYGGDGAIRHTQQQMKEFRDAGITVMSYFIGHGGGSRGEMQTFKQMYGHTAQYIDTKQVGQLVNTVNKLLMTEDDG